MPTRKHAIVATALLVCSAGILGIARFVDRPLGWGNISWDEARELPGRLGLETHTKEEVVERLGEPEWIDVKTRRCWIYELRPEWELCFREAFVLGVEFGDDGRVAHVSVWETPYTNPKWGLYEAWK